MQGFRTYNLHDRMLLLAFLISSLMTLSLHHCSVKRKNIILLRKEDCFMLQ